VTIGARPSRTIEEFAAAAICEMTGMTPPLDRSLTFADLSMDSLDVVEILQAVEDGYGVRVGESEAAGVKTLSDALALLSAKAAAQRPAAPTR
jgi:acyl carrier protein